MKCHFFGEIETGFLPQSPAFQKNAWPQTASTGTDFDIHAESFAAHASAELW